MRRPGRRAYGAAALAAAGALLACAAGCGGDAGDAGDAGAARAAREPAAARDVFDEPPALALEARVVWTIDLHGAGAGSPRLQDLDGDGVLEILLGIGRESVFGAVVALDARDGRTLWRRALADEVYATPCLLPVGEDDELPDVIVGQRRKEGDVTAIDARDGSVLWTLRAANPGLALTSTNFDTCLPCPDVDGDGRRDLLALHAGGDDELRATGVLYVVSSRTGAVLRSFVMPDGAESYASPAIERVEGQGGAERWRLVCGSGGETIPGHLFALDFRGLTERWRFASRGRKGFVAGLTLHDFEGEGRRDVLAMTFHGTLYRVDGETGAEIWRVRDNRCESYVTPALGRFSPDGTLDAVAIFSEGRWPKYDTRATVRWLDGRTGTELAHRNFGVMGMSSPLIADLDGDGYDEVLLTSNLAHHEKRGEIESRLAIFDGRREKRVLLELPLQGFVAGTPWLGDLDADGRLDLIVPHWNRVTRLDLGAHPAARLRWTEYRGAAQDGVVR